jgi:hypothetical protein
MRGAVVVAIVTLTVVTATAQAGPSTPEGLRGDPGTIAVDRFEARSR